MNQSFTYDIIQSYIARAQEAEKEGQFQKAAKLYTLAAKNMTELAETDPTLKETRMAVAKKLVERAQAARNGKVSEAEEDAPQKADYGLNVSDPTDRIGFDDIIGLTDAKDAIYRMLINPLKNPDVYKRYNLEAGGNILLEGPPGTGKTSFARAAACEIDLPFVVVDCNALVDSLIGKTGKNIDTLFKNARKMVKEKDTAVILFCDEFDAIAKSRKSDDKTAAEAVPTLIRQLDGFDTDNSNIVIIAATNVKDTLDKAILSRFAKRIYIPLPSQDDRRAIFESKLKKRNVDASDFSKLDLNALAVESDGLSGRDINDIVTEYANALAERDSSIRPMRDDHNAFMKELIAHKKR